MCEYPNVCVPIWLTIIIPLCTFIMGLMPYYMLSKREKLQASSDVSKIINAQFSSYKKLLSEYIEQAKTPKDTLDFTTLTNSFEELIGSLTDACEKWLNNALPKTSQKKFMPTIKEICDDNMIETYYSIVDMEYKKENYQIIFDAHEMYCKKTS